MRSGSESVSVQWIAAIVLLGVTVAAWLGRLHPVLELLPNARPVFLAIAAVAALGLLLTGHRAPAALALVAMMVHVVHLAPYVLAEPDPVPPGATAVRALQYNIYYNNDDLDAVVDHIVASDADVVAIHELLPDVWTELDGRLATAYPHRYAVPFDELDGQLSGGMALLSTSPLTPIEIDERYSPPDRVLLAATTAIDGREVTLVGLHPHASRFESRKVSLRATQIEGVVDLVERTDGPVIVLADLNVTPTSPVYRGFLDDLGWRDPHRAAGWDSTWPTWGGPLGFPIDHVLVSDHFAVRGATTGDGAGSDHRSLLAELSLLP